MAAGGSAPELFTALSSTFQESNVGFGTIVGSAVFNVLFVIGICAVASTKVLDLTWWPLFRDCSYYILSLCLLAYFMNDGEIRWYEAIMLFCCYLGYVTVMAFNIQLYAFVLKYVLKKDDITINVLTTEVEEGGVSLLKPTDFRAGLYSFLTGKGDIGETAGIAVVTMISGDVNETFKKLDTDGSGSIDAAEIGNLLREVTGEENISIEDIKKVLKQLDVNNDGKVTLDEFTTWYLASEARVQKDIKTAFDLYDSDSSGKLTPAELKKALEELNSDDMAGDEIDRGVLTLTGGDANAHIDFAAFSTFYLASPLHVRRQSCMKEQAEAAMGVTLEMPEDVGITAKLVFLITWPLMLIMKFTIPDVRVPRWSNWCYMGFGMSILWIGIFSNYMVTWAVTVGDQFGIPSLIMGLTFLAAGTSVPDLLSSVIVAKQGHGDMAVSSSIGSNIFDILVGLPLPWGLFCAYRTYQKNATNYVTVGSGGVFLSIIILVTMIGIVVVSIAMNGWKMTSRMGYFYFFMYGIFVAQELLRADFSGSC